jgi:short-subunit dehydrogenase
MTLLDLCYIVLIGSLLIVITGSSGNIGTRYAVEFAKRGMNIVLTSNCENLLRNQAIELGMSNEKLKQRMLSNLWK